MAEPFVVEEDALKKTVKQLLDEVSRCYKENNTLTDEVLSALQFVFQTPLQAALDLVDRRSVTKLTCPSGRAVFQVIGSSGTPYTCLTSSDYCGCQAYMFNVLKKGEYIMCKHQLAIRLSEAMGVSGLQEVSDAEMAIIITQLD